MKQLALPGSPASTVIPCPTCANVIDDGWAMGCPHCYGLRVLRRAEFSPAKRGHRPYRYVLRRELGAGARAVCMFVMLNPSTADEFSDDPSVRRCIRYARDWGYGFLEVLNAYAYRSTDPKALRPVGDPVGPQNDLYISEAAGVADRVVVAWGAEAKPARASEVYELIRATGAVPYALGLTNRRPAPTPALHACRR